MTAKTSEFRITGRHVFIAFGAFFGIVIAANILLAVLAARSFTGEDVRAAYGTGLRYNDILSVREETRGLGWAMAVERDAAAGHLTVVLTGATGKPMSGIPLSGILKRPVQAKLDRALVFAEIAPGTYRANIDGLAPGQWQLVVRAELADGRIFEAERRL